MRFPILLSALLAIALSVAAEPVTCQVEFDRPVVPAQRTERVVVKVSLLPARAPDNAERPAVNLAIVLDRSGSMQGDKIASARVGAVTALRRLGQRDFFSLVTYNNSVHSEVAARRAGNQEAIVDTIHGIQAAGGTALFGGVSQGAEEVRKHLDSDAVHRIILLSDGLANVGPSSPDDLARLGAALIKEGISVTTIGVGLDYNEDLMTRLSRTSDGHAYFVRSSDDLPRIFREELGEVLNIAARRIIIEIECRNGARPVRIIGRDGRLADNRVEIYLNQLYGGEEKYALVEIDVPAGNAEDNRDIVAVTTRYEDVVDKRELTATATGTIAYADSEEVVTSNMNEDVVTALVIISRAIARDAAIDLIDRGKRNAAVDVLGENVLLLEKYRNDARFNNWSNALFIDGHVEGEKALIEDLRTQEELAPAQRKQMRTENHQDLNQQLFR